MNIAIPLGGQIRMVICSSFVIAKRKDTTHYDLSGERMLHCILVTGNTGIGRNPQQFPFSQLHWLNQLNGAFHLRYPLS